MPLYTVWTNRVAIRNYQVVGSYPTGGSNIRQVYITYPHIWA
jgi:hypothetical protein